MPKGRPTVARGPILVRAQGCIKLGSGRLAEACTPDKHGRFGEMSLPTFGMMRQLDAALPRAGIP